MKNSLLFILITFLCTSCFAQSAEGLYKDMLSSSFVCVKNDSISIAYKRSEYDGPCYYYGTYRIVNDTILLGGNLLRHKNAIVDTVYTDYSGFEIQLFEQYPDIPMGAPVNHFSTSFLYVVVSNLLPIFSSKTLIYREFKIKRALTSLFGIMSATKLTK